MAGNCFCPHAGLWLVHIHSTHLLSQGKNTSLNLRCNGRWPLTYCADRKSGERRGLTVLSRDYLWPAPLCLDSFLFTSILLPSSWGTIGALSSSWAKARCSSEALVSVLSRQPFGRGVIRYLGTGVLASRTFGADLCTLLLRLKQSQVLPILTGPYKSTTILKLSLPCSLANLW